jgi:WD40 repeat protein/DNA-binding SARP family transcriptional activator
VRMAASRVEFRVLGPLTMRVDGRAVPVGGPKQRAILALLLLSANRVVSRERLIDELFAADAGRSADHALRNHVSRLRKLLAPAAADEPRLVARAPGYLLRVEPGELDLERYEQLVATGRDDLAAGDTAAAADSLRAAELLWQGRPLADLEFEPIARLEVERLEEVRLGAVEQRIDADLTLGRQLALIPELETLATEHPFRERFHAQLMLALYRCGRQAEGLDVYRRTRTLLQDELGLEPSVELQELERAILLQDPTLVVRADAEADTDTDTAEDVCPFKGLAPFEPDDAEFFFGRERLVEELVGRLQETPLLALVGPSGSGKSSLLRAGLLPALGHEFVIVRPAGQLPQLGGRVVLAVDQFEELFAPSVAEAERRAFVDALVDAAWDPERRTIVVLALRADFFGHLAPYVELADLVGPNHALLAPMSSPELRRAIEGPARRAGLDVEPELVDALVDDVEDEPGGLPLLSTALLDLWHERDGRTLTLAAYERTGGVRRAVAHHAEAAFRSFGDDEQRVARRILLRLLSGGDGEALTRRRVARAELDADEDETISRVLAVLVERRLLVADDGVVELVHEALLEQWPRLRAWVDEDAHGRRLHRHLTQAARDWERSGRESSELYRGARLGATLEWADLASGDGGLNRLERAFLDESRTAFVRANRRLRLLLVSAVALLLVALAAGAVALAARGTAKKQATAAIAQRLGAQALVEPRLDRALLFAREGVNLNDSPATTSSLLAALLRSPAALRVVHGHDPQVLDEALSGDAATLALRGNNGTVSFVDTRALRQIGPVFKGTGGVALCGAIVRPVRAVGFSPDGGTLAVGDGDGLRRALYLIDRRTHRSRATVISGPGVTSDVAYAPDGRTLVTAEAVSCRSSPPPELLTLRRASDGKAIRRSGIVAGGRLIGFTRDGRRLLVTSETTSYLLDSRTLAHVRAFQLSGAAAVSPAADTGAFGQDDGSVKLVDLRTGSVRPMARRATGSVIGVAFSRDGHVLATTSDDGTVDIWDVTTRDLRETFSGHAAAALAPVFSRDGATLYTASRDGTVIAWDVRGERRLGRPFRFAPVAHGGEGAHVAAPGAAGAVAVSPDSKLFATSPGPDRVTLWRVRDLAVVAELRGPCGGVQSIAFSHDGRLLAATGNTRNTVLWDVKTHAVVKLLAPSSEATDGVNFSADDRLIGTAGLEGSVRLYDVRTGAQVGKLVAHGTEQDLDFSSDGRRVAAAGLVGDISIWDLRTDTLERRISHGQPIVSIRFSPDGKQIATGDIPGNVDFWDADTGHRVGRELGGQNGMVVSVTYSPNADEVMTTSTDGKFRLWNLASGKLVGAPLPGSTTGGWGTFFPNGKQVIATFWSGIGFVWNVEPQAWRTQACRIANRNLTPAEWHDFLPERPPGRVC